MVACTLQHENDQERHKNQHKTENGDSANKNITSKTSRSDSKQTPIVNNQRSPKPGVKRVCLNISTQTLRKHGKNSLRATISSDVRHLTGT